MKMIFLLSWRNVWRNRRRSIVVITSIGLGILMMFFMMGISKGMNYQMIDNTISTSLGHVSVHKKGFLDNIKPSFSYVPGKSFKEKMEASEGIFWAPRVKVQAMIRSSESSRGVMIVGIDPQMEKKVSEIYDYTSNEEGSDFLNSSDSRDILVSKKTADKLDLVVGDRLVLMLQDIHGEMIGEALTVKGIFSSPVADFDKHVVFTGIRNLQRITGIENRISEITVKAENREASYRIKKIIEPWVENSEVVVKTWQEMAPSIVSAIKLYDSMMYIFFAIVFTTIVFSVANTMVMAIMERFHEIGVMKCLGTKPLHISIMILIESLNLGLLGMVAGILSGGLVLGIIMITGLDLSFFSETMEIWGSGTVIYPVITLKDFFASMVIVSCTAFIAAIYPAVKAARIRPLKALHFI